MVWQCRPGPIPSRTVGPPYLRTRRVVWAVICAFLLARVIPAQAPSGMAKVDFKRDVQPIFKANCYGCHGPTQQMNSLRLDRRRDAMRGDTLPVIAPGNSPASQLYLRLIGKGFGPQMPPTGPLPAQQVDIIKAWIDQGAPWPAPDSCKLPCP